MKNYTYSDKTNPSDLSLYKLRLNTVRLAWPRQVLKILKKYKFDSMLDIGCGYLPLYKEIKLSKKNYDYYGVDISAKFIHLGLSFFPELKKKVFIKDYQKFFFKKKIELKEDSKFC
jgi:SAM-dependent methyltransferase